MARRTDEKWIQVRISAEEQEAIRELASTYNADISTLVRAALNYLSEHHPVLEIRHAGKLFAPEGLSIA